MNKSIINNPPTSLPALLVERMQPAARYKFKTLAAWAKASGLTQETLSRLKSNPSCDLRTLEALARSAGFRVTVAPERGNSDMQMPVPFLRDHEARLIDLAASGNTDLDTWQQHGPTFFIGGLAVMLGCARGFDRERYMLLAEKLHPGISHHEVFGRWLEQSPVDPARFLPMVRARKGLS